MNVNNLFLIQKENILKIKRRILILLFILLFIYILFGPLKFQQRLMKFFYPIKYEQFVESYAKQNNLDKYMVYSVIKAESNFNENAQSSKGAKGLMQLMDETAKEVASKIDYLEITEEDVEKKLLEPQFNIMLGTKYLAILKEKYNNINLALVAYNAGSGSVDKWLKQGILNEDGTNLENIPFKETNNYVRKILNNYDVYRDLYK